MKEKTAQLKNIYAAFNADTRNLVQSKACTRGCREAGSIDITTLEGMVIRKAMEFGKAHRIIINRMVV